MPQYHPPEHRAAPAGRPASADIWAIMMFAITPLVVVILLVEGVSLLFG